MTSAATPHCASSNFMYLLTAVTAAARVSVGQWIFSKPYVLFAFHISVSAVRTPRSRASRSIAIATFAVCHSSQITSTRSPRARAGASSSSTIHGGRLTSQSCTFPASPSYALRGCCCEIHCDQRRSVTPGSDCSTGAACGSPMKNS